VIEVKPWPFSRFQTSLLKGIQLPFWVESAKSLPLVDRRQPANIGNSPHQKSREEAAIRVWR